MPNLDRLYVDKQKLGVVVGRGEEALGRERTYRLPRPTPGRTLTQVAQRLLSSCGVEPVDPVHYIAIATSGDGIAAAANSRHQMLNPDAYTWFSSVNPLKPVNFIHTPQLGSETIKTILVDNSIKTGRSALSTLTLLEKEEVAVDTVVSVVGYGDEAERTAVQNLSSSYGVAVEFLFNLDELTVVTDQTA